MTAHPRLILALADPAMGNALRTALPQFEVLQAREWSALPEPSDGAQWCFIDWVLPDTSGLELCRRLRAWPGTASAHITLVLDDSDPETRRRALKAGADDYVPGPLRAETVVERIHAAQSAAGAHPRDPLLVRGALEVDVLAHRAWYAGRALALRPKQFALLTHFMRHPDRVHTRPGLLEVLGNGAVKIDERTVDVSVGRLRQALRKCGAPNVLRTVRNIGYVFDSA